MKKSISLLTGLLLAVAAEAQMRVNKFILPDGKEIGPDKLDSVKKAWNGERILFQHNEEDDKNHVMHLVRMTPEMAKQLEEMGQKQRQAMQAMRGQAAPDFTLKDLTGKSWTLSALKGKVAVLNFWFTSCPPCNAEIPELNKLVENYQGKDIVFLALTFNDQNAVTGFLKEHRFAYTILPSSREVDKVYQVSSWPTSFVIGKDGKVAFAANYDEHIFDLLNAVIDKAYRQ